MEGKILEMIMKHIHTTKLCEGELINKSLMAEEITAHVMEFILWLSQNTEHTPYTDIYYVIGSGFNKMSLDELYQYWQENVNKQPLTTHDLQEIDNAEEER